MRISALTVYTSLLLCSCTPDLKEKDLDLSEPVSEGTTPARSNSVVEKASIFESKVGKQVAKVEYFSCEENSKLTWVVAINEDGASWGPGVCAQPEIQAFITGGYNVVAVNRPGYGGSLPKLQDFGGPTTQDLLVQMLKKTNLKISGLWSTGSGTIAAAFVSKKLGGISWLILGNGIYDLEQYEQGVSKKYKQLMKDAMGATTDLSAFHEPRSIAWDTTGLPRTVILYHTKSNAEVPLNQSQGLRDRLASEEYTVRLEEIDGAGHDIPAAKHALVITLMLAKLK